MVGTGGVVGAPARQQGDVHVQVATRPAPVVVFGVLSAALLCVGVALAGPAAAVDHEALPDARVTHGPSCRPGGVVVEVTAGTVGYAVTLATVRRPAGEDATELAPGAVVVLSTGPVAWEETVDPYLEYVPLEGSGPGYVDDLAGFDFTRPASGECAAISGAAVVPALEGPSGGTAAGSPAVAVAVQQMATGDDGGSRWPLLAAGGALLVAGTGVAVVSGSRRPGRRPQPTAPFGSA